MGFEHVLEVQAGLPHAHEHYVAGSLAPKRLPNRHHLGKATIGTRLRALSLFLRDCLV